MSTEEGVPTSVDFVRCEPSQMVASYTSCHTYIYDIETSKLVIKLDTKQTNGKYQFYYNYHSNCCAHLSFRNIIVWILWVWTRVERFYIDIFENVKLIICVSEKVSLILFSIDVFKLLTFLNSVCLSSFKRGYEN